MGKFGQRDTKKTQRNKIIKKGIKMARTGINESHMQQHKKKVSKKRDTQREYFRVNMLSG